MSESAGEVEVLSGTAPGGLRWQVLCSGDDEDLNTLLRVYSGSQCVVPGSGFGGPKVPLGSVMKRFRQATCQGASGPSSMAPCSSSDRSRCRGHAPDPARAPRN